MPFKILKDEFTLHEGEIIEDVVADLLDVPKIHEGVRCNVCNQEPIIGNRRKCLDCENFDLCEHCFEIVSEDHKHDFILFKAP